MRRDVSRLFGRALLFAALLTAPGLTVAEDVQVAVAETALTTEALPDASHSNSETKRTRFVIGLNKSVEFQVFALTNPNRVIIELPDAKLLLPALSADAPVGLVKTFRAGLSAPGRQRIVIDVTEPVVVESKKIEKTNNGKEYALAVQIAPVDLAARTPVKKSQKQQPAFALGAVGLQPPLPKKAERPDHRAARAFKPVIVIDPGHGGNDSGAEKNGTVEKEVVLAFGLALAKKLEESGRYKVIMTRKTDEFIPLDERRAIAEKNNASLFIAVHADYAGTKARGATIFSLRDSVATALKKSAKNDAGEKVLTPTEISALKQTSGDVDAVKDILSDLAEREVDATKDRTSIFTKSVIETMGGSTPMRDDPDQQAAFRVLKTAQFPSVLIELAYVTNKEDAQNLKSNEWRGKVADSIMTAVDNYFSHQLARLPM